MCEAYSHILGRMLIRSTSVRFLDNFSAGAIVIHPSAISISYFPGTRGATSAEYFIRAGYAVIFMHRQFSLQPYSRHYSHSTNPFLDFLETTSSPSSSDDEPPVIGVMPEKRPHLLQVLHAYKSAQASGLLYTLTFVTVNDYLWMLRAVSQELSILRRNALYYLAAAVSDFFLPTQKMVRPIISLHRTPAHIASSQSTRSNQAKEVFR